MGTPVAAPPGKWQPAFDHASRYWEVDCSATATAATADSSDDESFAILHRPLRRASCWTVTGWRLLRRARDAASAKTERGFDVLVPVSLNEDD